MYQLQIINCPVCKGEANKSCRICNGYGRIPGGKGRWSVGSPVVISELIVDKECKKIRYVGNVSGYRISFVQNCLFKTEKEALKVCEKWNQDKD